MESELGGHHGLSLRANDVPVIPVGRATSDRAHAVPAERQHFSFVYEAGHLMPHVDLGTPMSTDNGSRREREAHRVASAFLALGEAIPRDLHFHGGRVTLFTLTKLKEKWKFPIKALSVDSASPA